MEEQCYLSVHLVHSEVRLAIGRLGQPWLFYYRFGRVPSPGPTSEVLQA